MADYKEEISRIDAVMDEVERFIEKCRLSKDRYRRTSAFDCKMASTKEFASVRRSSMDLSRVLADLRQPIR